MKRIEQTIICEAQVPANLPKNSIVPVEFIIDLQKGPEPTLTPSADESIVIEDIYVTNQPTVDGVVQLVKNEYEIILQTDPLSTLSVTNPCKPKYSKKVVERLGRLSCKFINLQTPSTDTTVTFYMKIVRFRA